MKTREMFLRIFLIVAGAEVVIMTVFLFIDLPDGLLKTLLDAFLLITVSAPFLYLFVIRNLDRQLSEREALLRVSLKQELALKDYEEKQELHDRLLSLMNHVPGVAYRGFRDWSIAFIGAEVEKLTGHAPEEFTSGAVRWRDRIHPDDLERVKRTFFEAVSEGRIVLRIEYRILRRDGGCRWLEDRRQLLYDGSGAFSHVDGLLLDITENRQMAEALQAAVAKAEEERARAESILASIGDGISIQDGDFNVLYQNQIHRDMFGGSMGKPCFDAYGFGDHSCDSCPVAASFRDGRIHRIERCVQGKGGKRYLEITASPLRDATGTIVAGIEVVRDVTEQRLAVESLRLSEEHLRQAQKMEAVGRLAGGIAHDFNNVLTAITGYCELLISRMGTDSPLRKDAEEIRKAGDRAASLTRQLLAFSRRQVLQPKVLDLQALISHMNKMLMRLIGEDIELSMSAGHDLGRVKADPGQIEQVIMNLVVNARDAMPGGGKILIELANIDLDEQYVGKREVVRPGPYVALSVSDTGCGMDQETMARIFEPFFTTKEKGKGTGLGLATVYGIVKQSDGYIWVYSEESIGTTFRIYLPRVDETADPAVARLPLPDAPGGTETILLVEDDEALGSLIRRILSGYGFTVLTARGGEDACLRWGRNGHRIDLLLTDVVMPQMNGRELAARFTGMRPEIKVLYMSGYSEGAIAHQGILDEGVSYIQKPFSPGDLARKVRDVLDA